VSELPVIRVDNAHYQVEREDGSQPEIYTLPAGPGFILDSTGKLCLIPMPQVLRLLGAHQKRRGTKIRPPFF